jgi:ArsR family transcriptional regulator
VRDTARFFRVLGDEARLQMLWLLFNHRELCVCDIMVALEITQSKASRHLITLRHAGLVTDRKQGLWSYYTLRSVEDDLVRQHLGVLRTALAKREDAAALLERLDAWLESKGRRVECTPSSVGRKPAPRKASIPRSKRVRLARSSR